MPDIYVYKDGYLAGEKYRARKTFKAECRCVQEAIPSMKDAVVRECLRKFVEEFEITSDEFLVKASIYTAPSTIVTNEWEVGVKAKVFDIKKEE